MDTLRILLVISIFLLLVYVIAFDYRKKLMAEISLAERKVKEYMDYMHYDIISLTSRQKDIKVRGFHVGIKISAVVVNNDGNKVEMIMVHNAVTDKINIISENIVEQ